MEKMSNYNFMMNYYNGLTEEVFLDVMKKDNASKIFKYYPECEDILCIIEENLYEPEYRAVAILENGYVDIEMNFYADDNLKPVLDFCICANYKNGIGWGTDNFYGDVVGDFNIETDFSKDNWKEQLEKEMFDKLDRYCKVKGYDYTKEI